MTTCERCNENEASHRVVSDVMDARVCDHCAAAAYDITQKQPRSMSGIIRIVPISVQGIIDGRNLRHGAEAEGKEIDVWK